ncbi:MAG TPA: toxin TcdB middle/C-terminal domain-containing protein, partial [Puia sp.]
DKILDQCRQEYFQNQAFVEYDIPQPSFADHLGHPIQLPADQLQEAMRACKGLTLRTETYADDDTDKKLLPYSATQAVYEIRLLQPTATNRFASFFVLPVVSMTYGYEREPADPNVAQTCILEADEMGNVLKSASVVYPRVARPAGAPDKVWEQQSKMHIGYNEVFYTPDTIDDTIYRLRCAFESKAYDINGIAAPAVGFITPVDLKEKLAGSVQILFEEDFTAGVQRRLLAHHRSYFMNDAFTGARPLGEPSPLGMGHRSYRMIFTKGLVDKYYAGKVTDQMLLDAKYVHSENDIHWWVPTAIYIYPADPAAAFYTPLGVRDLFDNENFVGFDDYTFLTNSATDAIGNTYRSVNDYRTLSPVLVTDPNMNRAAVESDELGLTITSALMGKEGSNDGDTLADPTARVEYDFFNWKNNNKPNYCRTLARERHGAANPRWQENYLYSDGSGNVIMGKSQVNPGKARRWNAQTRQVEEVDADPRWIGNGRTIVNNKGNIIKQFERYFSTTSDFEDEDALVETGMSPLFYYDPLGRNIRIEFPNGTFTKMEFDAWQLKSFDTVDTVKDSPWYLQRGSPDPLADPEPADPEQRAAWLCAKYHNTPSTVHLDSLRRPFYSIADYGNGKEAVIYGEKDSSGRYGRAFDELGRMVSENFVNMLGQSMQGSTAEKGDSWLFTDAMGRRVKLWDNATREFRTTFDKLHRPVSTYVKERAMETLYGHIVYGDLFPEAEARNRNIKGKAYQLYDQSGVLTIKNIDFKGNITEVEQRITNEYKQSIDWTPLSGIADVGLIQTAADPMLDPEIFHSSTDIDALGRPITVTVADGSVFTPVYNEGNILASLSVVLRGQGPAVPFLVSQDYDARGQRQFAKFGNGTITKYFYDPQTFRLVNLLTEKNGNDDNQALQNIKYTFDAIGNITQIRDDAQQTHYFSNAVVFPESKFEYDAIYQLIKATGREHAGIAVNGADQRTDQDIPFINQIPHQNDANAVREYTENYEYDIAGNIRQLQHIARNANWAQRYQYAYDTDNTNRTNRLMASSAPGDADGVFSDKYTCDLHGNMLAMPHLSQLVWNFIDQLQQADLGGGGKVYYVYGMSGNRTRKVIERIGGKRLDRIYLGILEIYRERQGDNAVDLERYTLHVSDNTGRIAQVDTKTIDTNNSDTVNLLNQNIIRYQYTNHLGSASLEMDVAGDIISYEEYHPFGTSAYRLSKPGTDLSLKRYRFSGKERDEETGFYYFGARYYAAWLGRWTSTDPAGFTDGFNVYVYCSNNPIMLYDPDGRDDKPVVNHYGRVKSQISKADKTTDSSEARANIDKAFPEGTVVNKTFKVTGGSFWDKSTGENLLKVEPIGDQANSDTAGGTGSTGGAGKKAGAKGAGAKGNAGGGGKTTAGGKGGTGGTGAQGGTGGAGGTGGTGGQGGTGGAGGKGPGGEGGKGAGGAGAVKGGTGTKAGGGSGNGTGDKDGSGAGGGGLWDSLPTWAKVAVAVVAVVAVVAAVVFTGGLILEAGLAAAEAAELAAATAEATALVAETAEATAVVAETAEAAATVAEVTEATTATTSTLTSTATAVATNPAVQAAGVAATTEAARGGQDISAVAAVVEGEAPVIAEEGEAIALGVREHLDDFAKLVNAPTWKVWGSGNFRSQFLDMINNTSTKIYFNLTGPDGKMLDVWKAVSDGSWKRFGDFPITSWELSQLYQNKEALSRTIFYFQGAVTDNPFLK